MTDLHPSRIICYQHYRLLLGLLLFLCSLFTSHAASQPEQLVVQVTVAEAIGPATDDYLSRAINRAAQQQAELLVIRLDTPGGLDSSMRSIIKNIIRSPVPVASYVAPSGARAASAGTYILYASHLAVMAPGTNLGAATPVQIGAVPQPERNKDSRTGETQDRKNNDTNDMKRKLVNDAVAYIRGLAQMRGRNPQWAEQAVREAASLPANEALKLNVIDIVATDMDDLLRQAHGRVVDVQGKKFTLMTEHLRVETIEPDWRSRLLSVITNPNIAYILMLIGIYGLILEFSNPGAIVPGTIGAICLLLALYAFQLLPINYTGVALILLGIALMIAEAFEPSFGILGIGGTIAFVFGSIILIDTDMPAFGIDLSIIITFTLISAAVFIFVIGMAIKARRKPVVSGMEQLIGTQAVVIDDFTDRGKVIVHGETWSAHCETPLHKQQSVRITSVNGLTLEVEPLAPQPEELTS